MKSCLLHFKSYCSQYPIALQYMLPHGLLWKVTNRRRRAHPAPERLWILTLECEAEHPKSIIMHLVLGACFSRLDGFQKVGGDERSLNLATAEVLNKYELLSTAQRKADTKETILRRPSPLPVYWTIQYLVIYVKAQTWRTLTRKISYSEQAVMRFLHFIAIHFANNTFGWAIVPGFFCISKRLSYTFQQWTKSMMGLRSRKSLSSKATSPYSLPLKSGEQFSYWDRTNLYSLLYRYFLLRSPKLEKAWPITASSKTWATPEISSGVRDLLSSSYSPRLMRSQKWKDMLKKCQDQGIFDMSCWQFDAVD